MTVFLHIFGQACSRPIVFSVQSDRDEFLPYSMDLYDITLLAVPHLINQCDTRSPHSNSNESQQ